MQTLILIATLFRDAQFDDQKT